MNIHFDIIIPSRPNLQNLQRLLASIFSQNLQPQNIYIVIDKKLSKDEHIYYQNILTKTKLLTNINTVFEAWKWVSYVRNFAIKASQSEYILLLDDDTELPTDFINNLMDKYIYIEQNQQKDFVLFPTVVLQPSSQIQTQWYDMIHYWMMRPEPVHTNNDFKSKLWKKLFWRLEPKHLKSDNTNDIYKSWDTKHIYCCPSICLFGKASIFKSNLYDERMKFVYEDLDMTTRLSNKWIEVYNLTDLYINHYESSKTKLEASFLSPEQAYNKSKNRILFVQNNADRSEKLLFYFIWLAGQTLRFTIFVIIYGQRKIYSIGQIFKWIKDWFLSK